MIPGRDSVHFWNVYKLGLLKNGHKMGLMDHFAVTRPFILVQMEINFRFLSDLFIKADRESTKQIIIVLSWNCAYFSSTSASYCDQNHVFVWIFCHLKKPPHRVSNAVFPPDLVPFLIHLSVWNLHTHFVGSVYWNLFRMVGCQDEFFSSANINRQQKHRNTQKKGKKSWSLIDHPQSMRDLRAKVMSTHFNDEFILEPGRKTLHTGEGGLDYISHI